jgi:hypothetical protein
MRLAAARRPRAVLAAVTLGALAACGGGPTESRTVEVYALATVDGRPLPDPPPNVAGSRLLADTLYLLNEDRMRRVYVQTEIPTTPGAVNSVRTELAGEWKRVPSGYIVATGEGAMTFAVRESSLVRDVARPTGGGTMEMVYARVGP